MRCARCDVLIPRYVRIFEIQPAVYNQVFGTRKRVNQRICGNCFDENFSACSLCNTLDAPENQVELVYDNYYEGRTRYACQTCYDDSLKECVECGKEFSTCVADYLLYDGSFYCQECYENIFYTCDRCTEFVHGDDAHFEHGGAYCQDCHDEGFSIIGEYHSCDKTVRMFGERDHFGVELEVENVKQVMTNKDMAEICKELLPEGLLFFEADSSLDSGFEIITAPMSRRVFAREKANFQRMLYKLSDNGFRSHDPGTCGIHVHISRQALGTCSEEKDYTISKVLYLVEKHWNEMRRLSRRSLRQLEDWADRYGIEDFEELDTMVKRGATARHAAVNITPRNTIEFRLWRGSLSWNTFKATIDLVWAIVNAARDMEIDELKGRETLRDVICSYITPELEEYMSERDTGREHERETRTCGPHQDAPMTTDYGAERVEFIERVREVTTRQMQTAAYQWTTTTITPGQVYPTYPPNNTLEDHVHNSD